MSNDAWIKLMVAAGALVLIAKASGGPNKRPSVDGLPVWQNGNGPAADPGDRKQRPYCGVAEAC